MRIIITIASGLSVTDKFFKPAASICSNSGSISISEVVINFSITLCCSNFGTDPQVLLCTATVKVNDFERRIQLWVALLDPGSQVFLITNDCLRRLGLPKKRANVVISCLDSTDTYINVVLQISFSSHFPSNSNFSTSVYVVHKTVSTSHVSLDSSLEIFSDLKLAEPTFCKRFTIDILLGVNIALPILKGQMFSSIKWKPFAVRPDLGWNIVCKVPAPEESFVVHVNNVQLLYDQLINKFWELDSVPAANLVTTTEKACEEHFFKTYSRDKTGIFCEIAFPFFIIPIRG